MRLCLYNVTSCTISGGLETYYWEMGRALARRGHEVTLVAGEGGSAWHDEVRLVQFPFRVEQDWPDFGHRFQRLMERLSFARHALDFVIRGRFDAVLICKPYDFPVMWQARRRGMKSLVVFHTGGTDFYFGDRWFAGAVDRFIGVSRYTAQQQERRYGRPVSIIGNGVDVERFRPMARDAAARRSFGLPADARVLISVGRLVGWKGLRLVVQALHRLPPDVHYLAVGSGPEEPELRKQAAALGVDDRVHLPGRIDHGRLPGLLSEADLYVQPSIGEEAFGIGVIEAMACGVPVLAADNGGLREVVAAGETGWLAKRGDPEAWADALADALSDRERLQRMGKAARCRAETEFTWAAQAARLEALLKGGQACAAS